MIQLLEKCYLNLRTLTPHISSIDFNMSYVSVMQVLSHNDPTATALQTLISLLDRLSLVTSGVRSGLEVYHQSVLVDGSSWVEEILDDGPLISLDSRQDVSKRM